MDRIVLDRKDLEGMQYKLLAAAEIVSRILANGSLQTKIFVDGDKLREVQKNIQEIEKIMKNFQNEGTLTPETTADTLNVGNEVPKEPIAVTITKYLRNFGVPSHIKGYQYLRTAIELVVNDNSMKDGITKVLYPEVAKIHGTTSSRVERAIRHAIETSVLRCSQKDFEEIFGYSMSVSSGKPTNSHFISAIADDICMKKL